MNFATATRDLSFRERALNAASAAKLSNFADAYDSNHTHDEKVNATFAKTCSPLTRFATLCDTSIVKQLAFVMPSFKIQVMTCPFPAQGRNNEEVFAGSLGNSLEVFCPVTIRMKDVRGDLLSICETRAEANTLNLPTSDSNPLEEDAPPNEDEFVEVEAAGPDRIGIELNVATKEPCFVAIPKVIPVSSGVKTYSEFKESIIDAPTLPLAEPGSMAAVWYEAMRYGIRKLDNLSLQSKDVLFRYENIGKDEFTTANRTLVSRFTTIVTYLTPEDNLYHEVIKRALEEKEKAMMTYGTKILDVAPHEFPPLADPTEGTVPRAAGMNVPLSNSTADTGLAALLDGLAKAISDSSSKTLTGTERDKASEAEDAKRFYSILFGTIHHPIEEDGSRTPMFIQATIHPLFAPVLTANKNSKATKAMQEAIESIAAELGLKDDCYASSSNLVPRMFDQPLTAAIRTGQWEYQHTVLNPEGIKTNFGLHHLAPPRTNSAIYITRQQGELQLTQQEQVEEDKSRYNTKATDLYHFGYMGTIFEIQEMVGNFFGLMCAIIDFNPEHPPLIWTDISKFMKILRTNDGRRFATRHRNLREVMFNVGQEIQSIIVGYVSEARKTNYKAALKAGNEISPLIFDLAQQQAAELRSRFTLAVLAANAGPYKDTSAIFKHFQPEPTKEELNKKKREATNEANGPSSSRNRPFSSTTYGTRQNGSPGQSSNTITPGGSPATGPATSSPPGKTVFVHASPVPQKLPHPGAIFPHPTRENKFTILCCRSAYDGRVCTIPTCAFYHFPKQLNQVSRDLKDKIKEWVNNHDLVTWHADAANWANPPVPAYYPNLHLQIPTKAYHYSLPSTQSVVADEPTDIARQTAPSIPNLIRQTERVHLNTDSRHASSSNMKDLTTSDTTVSPSSHQIGPTTSEYLTRMTNPSMVPHDNFVENSTTFLSNQWKTGKLNSKKLDQFAQIVLPSNVQIQLAQPFGKDSHSQCFYAQKCFRHVLLPVLKSGFLSCRAIKTLEKASRRARQLQMLRKKYAAVDFRPLQGFQSDWEQTTSIRDDWKAMTSACLLHFNGDVATMVRWVGGPHVNAHLNVPAILDKLRPVVDPDIYSDISRILLLGAPAECKASATEENFQAFLHYGNHDSVTSNQEVFASTIVKQSKRGLTLIMDPKLIHFALNAHLSPQGLVDVLHPRRKPRPLSDSSFRPWPGAMAINDWTNKQNEPKLYFASSFLNFCKWQWNLAITYPRHDRHTGDDDVQCAFPRLKYNPQVVAMHSSISNNTLSMNTGLTFGDNTSPSNWEPIARARQQLAQHYWSHEPDMVIAKATRFLPKFKFAPPATKTERNSFATAIPDSLNPGVIDEAGNRLPPTFDHHVDDNMYGDITEFMPLAASASVIALYDILGYPDGRIPDPISWEKFESVHGHIRRVVGWDFNTRDLTFALPDDKRTALLATLREWCVKKSCTIIEAAELHGSLADASRANRKGRTMFFGFQNALRRTIRQRYHQVNGYYSRQTKREYMSTQLPKHLHHRLDSLIAREVATLIWKTKTTISLPESVAVEIRNITALMATSNRPWAISIGHIVPRDAQFTSLGDACGLGGGAFCHELQYWFDVVWSDHTRQQFDNGKIHINILEFVIVLIQLAAAITRDEHGFQVKGGAIQPLHKLLIRSDNSPSCNWAHKVSAKSERGQLFVSIYADLLERTNLTHPLQTDISKGAEVAVLQLFPPQSRTLIMPGIQAVHRTLASKPASAKVARTIRNRRLHYFIFCFDMKLDDDWLLENQSQERANFQLAMYATHLATGSSLHCRAIKANTIASYLHDIATFLGRFRPIDPRFISAADSALAPVIAKVIAEQRRWEMVPNRREPFTVEMHLAIANLPGSQKDDCCLTAAMANWTLCNLYAGCRGIEWAQTQLIHRLLNTFHKNRFKNAYAFTLNDVPCYTVNSSPLTFAQALATPSRVEKIKLRFEEQKNGENGEWKLFTRNNSNTNLCFVSNFLQILARHKRLANSSPTQPLSVYRGEDGVAYNITTVDIDATLRAAAAKVYQLDPIAHRATLQLWSSHSLRVGACTLLYSKGFSEMEIKYLLRWKSNAFMTYLRNLAVTSRRQNDAVNDTSEIPNFV